MTSWEKVVRYPKFATGSSALICPLPRVIYGFKVINGGNGDLSLRKFSLCAKAAKITQSPPHTRSSKTTTGPSCRPLP